MKALVRRSVATTTVAMAALTVTAPGLGAAVGPSTYAGEADALAVELSITGPQELFGPLDDSGTLLQRVSMTESLLRSQESGSVSTSLLQGLIDQATANGETATSGSETMLEINQGPISAQGGVIEWLLEDTVARSFSELAEVRISLAPLLADAPAEVREGLEQALDEATTAVNGLIGELNGALDQVEEAVNEATTDAPIDIPEVLPEALPGIPDLTTVDLVHVRKMWSESIVETTDDIVRSTAHGGVAELSLLGGLIEVPALQFTSIAETAGSPGTGKASTDVTTIAVRVGEEIVRLDGTTLTVGDVTLDLSDPQLEGVPVDEVLGPVQDVLAELLKAGGLSISQGEGVTEIAEDGSSATAATSALAIRLRPLQAAAGDTLDIQAALLPTRAAVAGSVAPAPAPEPALPRTGGGAVSILLGVIAMGGALLLHRRTA